MMRRCNAKIFCSLSPTGWENGDPSEIQPNTAVQSVRPGMKAISRLMANPP